MNCRSAGSKSSIGICFEDDAGLESGGLSKEPDFPSWAAPVTPRTQPMTKQLKLIRDNVNSPLSLNGLSPGLTKHRGARAVEGSSYLREEIRSSVWINGWAAAGTGSLLFRISLLLMSFPYNSRLASPSSVTTSPARSSPPKTPRDRE